MRVDEWPFSCCLHVCSLCEKEMLWRLCAPSALQPKSLPLSLSLPLDPLSLSLSLSLDPLSL